MAGRRTNNRIYTYLLLIPAIAGVALYVWRYLATTPLLKEEDTTFVRYPAFGIFIPTEYHIHGIDVSHHNKSINWKLVKNMRVENIRLGFSFMKATEGLTFVDDQFARNWKRSKQAGVVRGAYHYLLPYKSGEAQAQNFINTVDLQPGDLPPVLDVETIGGSNVAELRKNALEWLETVETYYGVEPIVYTGVDFYAKYLGEDFDDYPLWVAHYDQLHRPRIERRWNLWQHSMTGHVSGIQTFVDFNAFNGDSTDFRELLVK
jgi:lysozyme